MIFPKSNDASRERARHRRPGNKADRKPEKKRRRPRQIKLLGGLAAGVVGGLVATWVLDLYQKGALEATRRAEDAMGAEPVFSRRQEDQLREQQRAQVEAVERISRSTVGKRLNRNQRRSAATVVHYAAGALAGGAYGFAAELLPAVRRGYGTGYANLLFLGGSNAMFPWLRFGTRQKVVPAFRPRGLSASLVYGATLETTRRFLRWFL